jgi:hypothetical protein
MSWINLQESFKRKAARQAKGPHHGVIRRTQDGGEAADDMKKT